MLHVTCAIIEKRGQVLICQRSATMTLPLKWEFPGGKIEPGESKEACLRREIKEELGMEIIVGRALAAVTYQYPTFSVCLFPFVCQPRTEIIQRTEHVQAKWVDVHDLLMYDWAEADIPIVKEYLKQ